MIAIYKLLRACAPLALVVFLSSAIMLPALGQTGTVYQEYQVSSPTQVCRGDVFELTLTSEKGPIDQKAIDLILPVEFANMLPSPAMTSDKSLVYKIKAGQSLGDRTITIRIYSSPEPMTLRQKITVQQTYFEMAAPVLIAVGVVAIVVLVTKGL